MNNVIKNAYEDLANAIIVQAAKDYTCLLEGAKPTPGFNLVEIEKFFKSEWYRVLTKVDSDIILEQLRRSVVQ